MSKDRPMQSTDTRSICDTCATKERSSRGQSQMMPHPVANGVHSRPINGHNCRLQRKKNPQANHSSRNRSPSSSDSDTQSRGNYDEFPDSKRRKPIVIDKAHVVQLAGQYTSCAGCRAAVKALLKRPIGELRLLNAVMYDDEINHVFRLREQYLMSHHRLAQLLETFPLSPMVKKVQPSGVSLRCYVHRRPTHSAPSYHTSSNGNSNSSNASHSDNFDWEEAWDRLPAEQRERVAAIEITNLEAAMHHATATHRFCADCKHNVVTALEILTLKYRPEEVENGEEYNPELFRQFSGRIEVDAAGSKILVCMMADVEELITWHEDFDSQEYTSSGQRHAATLEHGQREIRSIIGSLLLWQLKSCWHSHTAQVQAEQYLFCLVIHAIRTHLASYGNGDPYAGLDQLSGSAENDHCGRGFGSLPAPLLSPDEAAAKLLAEAEEEPIFKKSKARKKKERRAKAKARRAATAVTSPEVEEDDEDEDEEDEEDIKCHHNHGAGQECPGRGPSAGGYLAASLLQAPSAASRVQSQVYEDKLRRQMAQDAGSLMQSCYDKEAEERLLKAFGAGNGQSLLNQSTGDRGLPEADEVDPALLKEMEQLKSSLQSKRDLQSHREHLRSRLASSFREYCDSK